jgi:methylenetetrahydrofolate--tRNA-(uracil-5-)-methyltransferase
MPEFVTVIGGGLAGCAASLHLSDLGIPVKLFEMRPSKMTPAHTGGGLAQLVCSNSLGSQSTFSANGLLLAELEKLNCRLVEITKRTSVPAGGALATDRGQFEEAVTKAIEDDKNINLVREEIQRIPPDNLTIIATGPLSSDAMISELKRMTSDDDLYFFDATSPTVTLDSIDMTRAFWGNRRDSEGTDYLNCPFSVEEFESFHKELVSAERVEIKDFEPDKLFESCLPIEIIGSRDSEALRFGPMKPIGLKNPQTGKGEYALVQLRREDKDGTRLNLVGFQTRLKYSEQKRVFSMIPALKNAEFVRLGHMHKNFYLNAPKYLDNFLRLKSTPNVFLAGQITGGEGYLEAVAQGVAVAYHVADVFNGRSPEQFPSDTMLGAFIRSLVEFPGDNYQPLKVSFGMLPELPKRIRNKRERRGKQAEIALQSMADFIFNTKS